MGKKKELQKFKKELEKLAKKYGVEDYMIVTPDILYGHVRTSDSFIGGKILSLTYEAHNIMKNDNNKAVQNYDAGWYHAELRYTKGSKAGVYFPLIHGHKISGTSGIDVNQFCPSFDFAQMMNPPGLPKSTTGSIGGYARILVSEPSSETDSISEEPAKVVENTSVEKRVPAKKSVTTRGTVKKSDVPSKPAKKSTGAKSSKVSEPKKDNIDQTTNEKAKG